jgi:methylenetetrahydrofolate dehydrogenase (NADP+)/methenyltetrahydrofolate cyclohydrolase
MKLETSDLVGFIKERHRVQLKSFKPVPRLALVDVEHNAASASFIRAKQQYGADIGAEVIIESPDSSAELNKTLKKLSEDSLITGIVLQLPLPESYDTQKAIDLIKLTKDVDGLRQDSPFDPAAAKAILWILANQKVDLKSSHFVVVGQGRLVGAPIAKMLEDSGAKVERCDVQTKDLAEVTKTAEVVISGTGHPGLIAKPMLKTGAILIDAGTSEVAAGKLAGDAARELYDDAEVLVTPVPGGVGPATVAALFDNLLTAAANNSRVRE